MRKPTIYEALRTRLGREPTNAELKADVERIKEEVFVDLARRGRLPHQRGLRRARSLPAKLQVTPMSREDASALLARSERSVAARRAARHESGENPRVSAPLKKRIDRVLGRGR